MPTAVPAGAGIEPAPAVTFADKLRALGGVPPDRVIWLPRSATEDDVIRYFSAAPRRRVELVDGILVEKPMGVREAYLAASLIGFLWLFNRTRNLGVVGAPDAIMRLREGQTRLPDVHFTSWANLPDAAAHLRPVGDYPPDLAVEILSESNRPGELRRKIADYFAAGTRLVWVVDPDARTVAVYTDPDTHTVRAEADTLDGGTVLPGFALPLAELFNDPQLNPRPGT